MTREFKLPSGAVLRIQPAPFKDSKALYQAILKELRSVTFMETDEAWNLVKDLFSSAFSSPAIDAALEKCFERCTYDGGDGKGPMRVDGETFEAVERRKDYLPACVEVARDNVFPFVESLFSDFKTASSAMKSFLGSKA